MCKKKFYIIFSSWQKKLSDLFASNNMKIKIVHCCSWIRTNKEMKKIFFHNCTNFSWYIELYFQRSDSNKTNIRGCWCNEKKKECLRFYSIKWFRILYSSGECLNRDSRRRCSFFDWNAFIIGCLIVGIFPLMLETMYLFEVLCDIIFFSEVCHRVQDYRVFR